MLATLALLLTQGQVVDAGPDTHAAAGGALQLAGALSGGTPLAWLTADGNGPSEDMLVRYDALAGQTAVGLLASPTKTYGWLGDLVEIGGVLVGNSVLGRELFTVDPANGACAWLAGPFDAMYGDVHSLAYDAAGDRLFGVDLVERELIRIDYVLGTATAIGTRTLAAYPWIRALGSGPWPTTPGPTDCSRSTSKPTR